MNLRSNRTAGRWWARAGVAVVATAALGPGIGTATASDTGSQTVIGDASVFAIVPAPGHPFGVAVDKARIYISTSAGDFFADPANRGHLNSDGERVFAYDKAGKLLQTTTIATG